MPACRVVFARWRGIRSEINAVISCSRKSADSHIGLQDANPDPGATLQSALDKLKLSRPAFLTAHRRRVASVETGRVRRCRAMIGSTRLETHTFPASTMLLNENPNLFFQRFTPSAPKGWYSFDHNGVHFVH